MSWNSFRGRYQSSFVPPARSSSKSSADSHSERRVSHGAAMNSVPPPMQLTMANATARAGMSQYQKEMEKKKEEDYLNMVYKRGDSGKKESKEKRTQKHFEDDYLEKEDEEECSMYYQQKRAEQELDGSSSSKTEIKDDDEDEDDLDAFMAGVEAQAAADKKQSEIKETIRVSGKEEAKPKEALGRTDLDEEDMQESMMKYLAEYKEKEAEKDEVHEYDEDGNIIYTWKRHIDPLPELDHSTVNYESFQKCFYHEHKDIADLNYMDVVRLREKLNIKIGGGDPPKPVCSFAHFGFDKRLMEAIRKSEYEQPTPIQAQAIPAILAGRDVLGIAKTGSGKTAAYLWPAIVHIMDQPDLKPGDGPIVLIVVPTRELAIQVYQEAKRFCKLFNINVICAYGGGSKWEQQNELQKEGAEMVVCTPGRIIDLIKIKATNFTRVTFLVFDEADRMFDLGFEPQVMSISKNIRTDRQCLMFSATFQPKVEHLAKEALCNPVRIVQGHVGEANEDITQIVHVMPSPDVKWNWLCKNLVEFCSEGKVLIFVTKKTDSEDVAARLKARDFKLELLHGDMLQHERNEHLSSFRKNCKILVATDVAARGLDIPEIRTVVNYDVARDIDTHVHRVGRTGRAGQKGTAYTLVCEPDKEFTCELVKNLESMGQQVSNQLLELALKVPWFKAQYTPKGNVAHSQMGRSGLGFESTSFGGGMGGKKEADPLHSYIPTSRPSYSYSEATSSDAGNSSTSPALAGPASQMQSSRVSAMKNAFKSSFAQKFQRAQLPESNLPDVKKTDPRPEWKRKIDEINSKIASGEIRQSSQSSEESYNKKSRWG